MSTTRDQILKADRLYDITQRVGFALWQLQELEGVSAQYYVLVVHASPGMGVAAGQALVDKAQSKTFGSTVTQLVKAKQLAPEVEERFQTLLAERNWLVHSSRSTSRNAVHDANACRKLIERLDAISKEAGLLLKEVGQCAEAFVKKHGVSTADIELIAAQTLKKWHGENAP